MEVENQDVEVSSVESSATEQETSNNNSAESSNENLSASSAGQQQDSGAPAQEKQAPFHEHPRFRELVEQKNLAMREAQETRRALEQMQKQFEKRFAEVQKQSQPVKEDPMVSRLKSIDPEFGAWAEEMSRLKNQSEEMRQQILQEVTQQQLVREARQAAITSLNNLHEEYKVPKEWRNVYNDRIEAIAIREGEKLTPADLPNVYKRVHDELVAAREQDKRAHLASYASAKAQDAAKPGAQPKGKPVAVGKKADYSKDPAEARAQLVKSILNSSRAEKDI